VQPHLYGENGDEPDADPGRDLLSMALIAAALERRIPIFAICRGLQELVVATGGRCIVVCSSRMSCLNIAKILNCRLSTICAVS
jgi:gamma-glutamyl-gamma-aminobutyrate hydrolase PuuD